MVGNSSDIPVSELPTAFSDVTALTDVVGIVWVVVGIVSAVNRVASFV